MEAIVAVWTISDWLLGSRKRGVRVFLMAGRGLPSCRKYRKMVDPDAQTVCIALPLVFCLIYETVGSDSQGELLFCAVFERPSAMSQ